MVGEVSRSWGSHVVRREQLSKQTPHIFPPVVGGALWGLPSSLLPAHSEPSMTNARVPSCRKASLHTHPLVLLFPVALTSTDAEDPPPPRQVP